MKNKKIMLLRFVSFFELGLSVLQSFLIEQQP